MSTTAQSYGDSGGLAQETCASSDLGIQTDTTPCLISRIHPEILQMIFIYGAFDHYISNSAWFEVGMAPSWVNVSYVCRHWRDVALACPVLWSYLPMAFPRWTEELLARSKQASLRVQVNSLSAPVDQALRFVRRVTNHLERIQELSLETYDLWETEFCSFLCARAPRLQYLEIIGSGGAGGKQFPVLFEGDTPALRTLKLTRCAVPWYSFRLSDLTTLGLYEVPVLHQKTVAEFLTMLRSMQRLENLYVWNLFSSDPDSRSCMTSHALQVDLPHLSRLFIVALPLTVVAFLTGVKIPSKTEFRLGCDCQDELSVHACVSLFSVLGNHHTQSTPTWRSLVIEHVDSAGKIVFTFSTLEHDLDPLDPWHLQWTRFTPFKIRLWLPLNVMGALLSVVPLPDVHMLHVVSPPYEPEFWRGVMESLPGVRAIRLSSGDLPDLASVLAHDHAQSQDPGQGQGGHADRILAPALEALELYEMGYLMHPARQLLDVPVGDLESLCMAIATRHGGTGRLVVNRWGGGASTPGSVCQLDIVAEWTAGRIRVRKTNRPRGLRM